LTSFCPSAEACDHFKSSFLPREIQGEEPIWNGLTARQN
jgi:hypothetical protein